MSHLAKRQYLKVIRERYQKATKKEKSIISSEFCEVCGYKRKYAISILNDRRKRGIGKRGRRAKYGPDVIEHLLELWIAMKMCSKKMVLALPLWLKYYKSKNYTDEIEHQLLQMSSSTIDRLLKPYRKPRRKGLSGTKSWVKSRIPLELLDKNVPRPWFV